METRELTFKSAKSKSSILPRIHDQPPSRISFFPGLTSNSACKAAMGILKSGGSALDAVEMAIIVMEDDEMTNAGYGSNLTIEGAVECDATIVDHHGRSGAAGAVSRKFFFFLLSFTIACSSLIY